jgi:DNA-binding transcriptional LysR family regulator
MLMELRHLHYFVAVADEASFTRAAARVHVAQPAVSQQIGQLERELGQRLFDRSDRRIRLTPAGETFLPYARSALEATAAGRDAVASLRGVLTGRLAIGTIQSPPESLIALIGEFHRASPKVDITLSTGHPESLAADVAMGKLDAAILGLAGQPLPAVVETRMQSTEPLVVVVAPDHPIARRASTTLAALRNEVIITLTSGSGLRAVVEAACARAGFTPQIRAETDDVALLADLARHGLGVALIPQSSAERAQQPLVTVALRRPTLTRRIVIAWHRHRTTAPGDAFLTFAHARTPAT